MIPSQFIRGTMEAIEMRAQKRHTALVTKRDVHQKGKYNTVHTDYNIARNH